MRLFSSRTILTLRWDFRQNSNLHFDLQSTTMACTFTKSFWRPFFLPFLGKLSGRAELGLPHWILRYLWRQWNLRLTGTGQRGVGFLVQPLFLQTKIGKLCWWQERTPSSTAEVPLSSLPNPLPPNALGTCPGQLTHSLSPLPQYICMCSFVFEKMLHVFVIIKRVCNWFPPSGINKVNPKRKIIFF